MWGMAVSVFEKTKPELSGTRFANSKARCTREIKTRPRLAPGTGPTNDENRNAGAPAAGGRKGASAPPPPESEKERRRPRRRDMSDEGVAPPSLPAPEQRQTSQRNGHQRQRAGLGDGGEPGNKKA
jgi:hypothetical protein